MSPTQTNLYAVPAHLTTLYADADVTVPTLRGDTERGWAMRYVRAAYRPAVLVESDPQVESVRRNPAELDRYVLHVLKLEAALAEYNRPQREAEAEAARRLHDANNTCPCCGEINGHRPRTNGHDVCDSCDLTIAWLLMREAAKPARVVAVESLLGL